MKKAYALAIAAGLAAAGLIINSGNAWSSEQPAAAQCSVTIMATKGGQPIMAPVNIAIYRYGALVTSTMRHSLITTLDCGDGYLADMTFGNIKRQRPFAAVEGNDIVVAMD